MPRSWIIAWLLVATLMASAPQALAQLRAEPAQVETEQQCPHCPVIPEEPTGSCHDEAGNTLPCCEVICFCARGLLHDDTAIFTVTREVVGRQAYDMDDRHSFGSWVAEVFTVPKV